PKRTRWNGRWRKQVWPGLPVASSAVADESGVHNAVAAANHEAPARVICESNARLELMFRRIKCSVRPSIHAELLPFSGERVEEASAGFVLLNEWSYCHLRSRFNWELESILKSTLKNQE